MNKNKWGYIIFLISILVLCSLYNTNVYATSAASTTERLAGNNRFETSIAISKANWVQADTVIIASGLNYPDALAATSLSKLKNAPILLSGKDTLDNGTIEELKRLKTTKVFLIGGIGVIGTSVESQLSQLGINITRIGGIDRYDTSKKVAELIGVKSGIAIVEGTDFPSALSIAPISSVKGIPIILSPASALSSSVEIFIKGKTIPVSYLVGSTGTLNDSLGLSVPNGKKLGAEDKYTTNLAINENFSKDLKFDTVYLASGNDFPDALSGSALAAKNNAPIILTDNSSISDETIDFIKKKNVKHVVILGGIGAVSQEVEDKIKNALEGQIIHVTSISLNKTKDFLTVGDTEQLIVTINPSGAANKYITWKSSDTNIASVDNIGNVTAVTTGAAIITVTSVDGNYSGACEINVMDLPAQNVPQDKSKIVFAIDIGHNAKYNTGAVGIRTEDNCTKEVGSLVMEKLINLGYTVIDTSPTNPTSQTDSLKQRVDIANAANANYYVSIHFNKFDGVANGTEIFMGSSKIKTKAQNILNNFVNLGYANRGLQDNSRGLYVLKNTKMPAMLIECSFVDSIHDMNLYDADAMAQAIVDGLIADL